MPLDQRGKAVRRLLPGDESTTPSVLVSGPLSDLSGVCDDSAGNAWQRVSVWRNYCLHTN